MSLDIGYWNLSCFCLTSSSQRNLAYLFPVWNVLIPYLLDQKTSEHPQNSRERNGPAWTRLDSRGQLINTRQPRLSAKSPLTVQTTYSQPWCSLLNM